MVAEIGLVFSLRCQEPTALCSVTALPAEREANGEEHVGASDVPC